MGRQYNLTVAPNGATLRKANHAGVPVTETELVETATACFNAGAGMIHLHVRAEDERHTLDAERYKSAISAIERAAPGLKVQITTESGGIYGVREQLACIRDVKPKAASVAVREIARDPKLASEFYHFAAEQGTAIQHILYAPEDLKQLTDWIADGTIPDAEQDVLLVLGRYSDGQVSRPEDLEAFLPAVNAQGYRWTVCAFGEQEQACLLAALKAGGHARIGFENNRTAPDGSLFDSNRASVESFVAAAAAEGFHVTEHFA